MEKRSEHQRSSGKVLALINKMEPLAARETIYSTPKQNKGYDVLWAEDLDFSNNNAAGGLRTEVAPPPIPAKKAPEKQNPSEKQKHEDQRSASTKKDGPRRKSQSSSSSSSNKKSPPSSNERKSSSSSSTSHNSKSSSVEKGKRQSINHQNSVYDMPEDYIPQRGDSRRKLPDVPDTKSPCCHCRKSSRCIVVILVILMLAIGAGVIVGTLFALKPCTESFTKYKDQFVVGRVLQSHLSTQETCSAECLKRPWCGGYDFDRLTQKCFVVTGAVDEALLQPAKTTDHFERHGVCTKSDGKPQLCTMVHSSNGHASGGVDVGKMSLENCTQLCQIEDGCKGVDYNTHTTQCFVHTISVDVTKNPCCVHYSKACKRCQYTLEMEKYTSAAILVDHIHEVSQCGLLCNQKTACTGFDFELIPRRCALVYAAYQTISLANTENYRKGVCTEVKGPS